MGNNTLIKSLRSIYWACHRQNAGVSHSHQSSYLDCSFSIVEMWTKCICDVIKVRQTHEDNPFLTRLVAYNRWKGSLSTMGVCIEKRSCENTARILLQFKERSHPKLNWSHLDLGLPSLQNLKKKKNMYVLLLQQPKQKRQNSYSISDTQGVCIEVMKAKLQ